MQKIHNLAELKDVIRELQARQDIEWPLLKEQFLVTAEHLKPGNIMKSAFSQILSVLELKSNAVTTVIGLTTGFLVTKAFSGNTTNPLTRLIVGAITGLATVAHASKAIGGIRSIGNTILKKVTHPNRTSKEKNGNFL